MAYYFVLLAAPNLRQKLRVRMINAQGLEEAGVDGGGIFRLVVSGIKKIKREAIFQLFVFFINLT